MHALKILEELIDHQNPRGPKQPSQYRNLGLETTLTELVCILIDQSFSKKPHDAGTLRRVTAKLLNLSVTVIHTPTVPT
jgi:hypothetical protein